MAKKILIEVVAPLKDKNLNDTSSDEEKSVDAKEEPIEEPNEVPIEEAIEEPIGEPANEAIDGPIAEEVPQVMAQPQPNFLKRAGIWMVRIARCVCCLCRCCERIPWDQLDELCPCDEDNDSALEMGWP